ncbi:MAG: F0F1 ATP synthase subunit B [Candidatus Magasanikbacteria bacterium]
MSQIEITTEQKTETATEGGVAASLGLNTQLFLFQLLNFAIVAAIVWFLILKPLTKKLEERKNVIDESLDKAKEIETKFVMSEQKYQERLDDAKVEANKLIERAHTEGKQLGEDMKLKAKEEIEGLVVRAKHQIQNEKEKMVEDIKSETADLVVMALEKVLGEKMDSEKDKKIIEDSLKGLKK